VTGVLTDMTTTALSEIHERIERASEQRAEIWHRLSEGHDPELRAELNRLNRELDRLWDEHRALRARLRFGDRDAIVARARVEERLERAA
jgi:ABC-type phosphate transport system auxiliary subunit